MISWGELMHCRAGSAPISGECGASLSRNLQFHHLNYDLLCVEPGSSYRTGRWCAFTNHGHILQYPAELGSDTLVTGNHIMIRSQAKDIEIFHSMAEVIPRIYS
jgi:hypothetical protein